MDTIAEKFKKIRKEKDLTQQGLADILNVTKQNIANIEGSLQKPSIELIKKLVEILNINANWLIADKGSVFNQTPNEVLKDELRKEFEALLKAKGL